MIAAPAPLAPAALRLRVGLAALATLAFAVPNLTGLWYGADPLTIANESVGYRYLFSERLLHGEGASVWVLAGFLTTAIQTTWLACLNLVSTATPESLPGRLMVFSYGFSFMVVAGTGAVLLAAARNPRLRLLDCLLLLLPALGPVYTTRRSGFYYYTLPDYYHLNVFLTVLAVWLFLRMWRAGTDANPTLRRIFLFGLLVGAMAGNKITMMPLGLVLLAPAVFGAPLDFRRLVARAGTGAAGLIAGFLGVIWWFYLFKFSAVADMFGAWLGIVRDPGGESDFWSSNFRSHLTGYSYGYIFAFYLIAVVLAVLLVLREPDRRRRLLVGAVGALGGVTWAYFIYKRPAGTTFFEAAVALLGFAAVALAVLPDRTWARRLVAVLLALLGIYSVATMEWRHNLAIQAQSVPWARSLWQLHREVIEFAHGREIIVVHPQNHYGYGGVAEFLLKGTADVPTWNVSDRGRPILERYFPRATYRHDYSGPSPDSPYPGDVVIFWVDRPEFAPLAEQYPQLARAIARRGAITRRWTMSVQGDRAKIVAHAVLVPPEDVQVKQQTVAKIPEGLSAAWIGAGVVRLTWAPDPAAETALQACGADGEWFAVRRLPPGVSTLDVAGLNPAERHVFRARKELDDRRSSWTEYLLPPAR